METQLSLDIKTLKSLKGSNSKLDFLRSLKGEQESKMVEYLTLVYSPFNWYQSKLPAPAGRLAVVGKRPLHVIEAIRQFSEGERRGSKGAQRLSVLSALMPSEGDRDLLKFAIWKDIKAGVGPKTINKVWPGLIFIPPYQRCSTLDEGHHLEWDWGQGVFVQNKEDQMFGNLNTGTGLLTRNFNLVESESVRPLKDWASRVADDYGQLVFHGEIQVKDADSEYVTREKSNGLVNGMFQTGLELPPGFTVNMTLWNVVSQVDFMNGSSSRPYKARFELLKEIIDLYPCDRIRLVQNDVVTTMEEIKPLFMEVLKRKGEGLVIKNSAGVWSDNDSGSPDEVKVKIEMEIELRVVAINEADDKSKHRDTFASLQCVSEDNKIVTGVSGFTDEMRLLLNESRDSVVGSIISVRVNGIQWNDQEPHSLYYPQFIEVRSDKHTANTLEEIMSIQDAAIMACMMSKSS